MDVLLVTRLTGKYLANTLLDWLLLVFLSALLAFGTVCHRMLHLRRHCLSSADA